MTRASHTALQIDPSDLIPKVDPATLRKRFFSPQKRPVARLEAIEHQPERNEPEAPVERIWPRQHDAHVMSFVEWKANPPLGWLKMRCREMGVVYEDIVGDRRFRELVPPRKRLMAEMKAKFPHMSFPAIGRMFGGRDHTTVLHAIKTADFSVPLKLPIGYHANDIERMFREQNSFRAIGRALGYDGDTVAALIKRMGWTR